jgi:hypothetical protein
LHADDSREIKLGGTKERQGKELAFQMIRQHKKSAQKVGNAYIINNQCIVCIVCVHVIIVIMKRFMKGFFTDIPNSN